MTAPAVNLGDRSACALASRIASQILDVFAGRRPLNQIRGRLSGPVVRLIATRLRRRPTRDAGEQLGNYRLGSVHACLTTPNKVEACAVIGAAGQARAVVMRLEQRDTTWSCTMFSVL